ncbi:Hypothetical predicted protein [Pelobates cultripes]|uniref:Uncharacterized protein n=1 Tax=Pelobates cultripes TaxID=61616 RepID=A0AAD1VUG3_PELCU|nr:Hypothetical predicted protein [Pelobates cultripes]
MLLKLKATTYHTAGKAAKTLANRLRAKLAQSRIPYMQGDQGNKSVGPQDISQESASFYSKLYYLRSDTLLICLDSKDIETFLNSAHLPKLTTYQGRQGLDNTRKLSLVLEQMRRSDLPEAGFTGLRFSTADNPTCPGNNWIPDSCNYRQEPR